MRSVLLVTAAMLAASISTASAATWETKDAYPACLSEALYNEAWMALRRGDAAHFLSIKGCILTKSGIRVGLVDRGAGWAKVRLIDANGQSVVVYTHPDNLVQAR